MDRTCKKLGQILCELCDVECELIEYQKQALINDDMSMAGAIDVLVQTLTEAGRKMNSVIGDLSYLEDEWNGKEAKRKSAEVKQQFSEPLPKSCLPGSVMWRNERMNLDDVR